MARLEMYRSYNKDLHNIQFVKNEIMRHHWPKIHYYERKICPHLKNCNMTHESCLRIYRSTWVLKKNETFLSTLKNKQEVSGLEIIVHTSLIFFLFLPWSADRIRKYFFLALKVKYLFFPWFIGLCCVWFFSAMCRCGHKFITYSKRKKKKRKRKKRIFLFLPHKLPGS